MFDEWSTGSQSRRDAMIPELEYRETGYNKEQVQFVN